MLNPVLDVLIRGGTLLTMNPQREVVRANLRIRGNRIVGIEKRSRKAARVVDATDCIVMPGLIQSHVHLCQALFRGMADGLALLPWLKERIWPLEAAHTEQSLQLSANIGMAEMMLAGTTSVLDMGTVHAQDALFEAIEASGLRAWAGKAMMDRGVGVPKGLHETTASSLAASERLQKRWHGAAHDRLRYAYAPRFVLSCSEDLLRAVADAAQRDGSLIHTHAAEHAAERKAVKEMLGKDDVAALASFGVAGPHVVMAHGVQLRPTEMRRIARQGTRFVHCPSANLKLGSGVAPIRAMRDAGVVVGIGADGAPCNNRMDPWAEMREAALLGSMRDGDPASVTAEAAMEMATIDGARALGATDRIGSLEAGKLADIVIIQMAPERHGTAGSIASRLVYNTRASDVRHVFIDGNQVVRNRELLTIDVDRVRRSIGSASKAIARRAGVA